MCAGVTHHDEVFAVLQRPRRNACNRKRIAQRNRNEDDGQVMRLGHHDSLRLSDGVVREDDDLAPGVTHDVARRENLRDTVMRFDDYARAHVRRVPGIA